jgi:hypothetical protein
MEQPAKTPATGKYHPSQTFTEERGAYVVPLAKTATWVALQAN